jgi:hypothetical protein
MAKERVTHRPMNKPPVKLKLGGKPRPNGEVQVQWKDAAHKLMSSGGYDQSQWAGDDRLRRAWGMLLEDTTNAFRWRIKLDCGCIEERLRWSTGADDPEKSIVQGSDRDLWLPVRLPPGQYRCRAQYEKHRDHINPPPVRDIVEWLDDPKEKTVPADPIEPPDRWNSDREVWARIRHDEHQTMEWTVKLECGHFDTVRVNDLAWRPGDPPVLNPSTPERIEELKTELTEMESVENRHYANREWWIRMLDAGWPKPAPFRECRVCPNVHHIVAYEPIGWVESNEPPPPLPKPPRKTLETRLGKLEAEAKRLREQLKDLDEDS